MAAISIQILVVGATAASTEAMLLRLEARGWGARRVNTVAEAKELMATFRFAVVLAAENLRDGSGYDLAELVAQQSGDLFVGIVLTDMLWLPAVEHGVFVLGQRALNSNVFENEVELALGQVGGENRAAETRRAAAEAGTSHRLATAKRRGAQAA
jgi:DNA-binding NtrC family response regulator